jgi:hypothetical protein
MHSDAQLRVQGAIQYFVQEGYRNFPGPENRVRVKDILYLDMSFFNLQK